MNKHKELLKNTTVLMVGKLFTQFLTFFLLPLYTYLLPVDEYGLMDLILTYISLLIPVVTIQQEMATFRHLIDARMDKKSSSQIIRTSFRSVLIRLLVFAIPYIIVTNIIQWKYAYLVLVCGVFTAISNLLLQIARGLGENTKYTIGSIVAGIVTIISNFLLICVCHFGGESILISMAIANLFSSIYLFISLNIKRYLTQTKPIKSLRNKMLKYSWPLVPNGISWWLINASDRTIVSAFLGVAENGIYAIATKFPSILSSFLGVFILSWTESASIHINDIDRDAFFSDVARNTVKIFSSLGLLIIATMPFVFDIIIGPEYREAYNYIPIAILGVLFSCMVSIYSAIYVAKKMTKQVASTSIIAAIINIVVDLALIKLIGLYSAVVSTAVAYFVMTIYRHFDIRRYVKIKYNYLELLFVIIGSIIVSTFYYCDNIVGYIFGAVFAAIYTITINWIFIYSMFKKIRQRKERIRHENK